MSAFARRFLREVAVRIELGGDQHTLADDRAHALQQIALAIVVALRDHRAVQAEDHRVDGQRGAQADRGSRRAGPRRSCAATARPARPRPPYLRSG